MSCGPFVQFLGYNPSEGLWQGSVLLVTGSGSIGTPDLLVEDFEHCKVLPGQQLDQVHGSAFWRYELRFSLTRLQRRVTYSFAIRELAGLSQSHESWSFVLPSNTDAWHWGYYTDNYLDPAADPEKWGAALLQPLPLWADVQQQHRKRPLHVMLAGGNQVVQDSVFAIPALQEWLLSANDEVLQHAYFTADMEQHMLRNYLKHFRELGVHEALATIPHVMLWNDRDIFQGWGTLPDVVQKLPVLQGIFRAAQKLYLLFQHHTTPELAAQQGYLFGDQNGCHCFLRQLGATAAVLGLDLRARRSSQGCCPRKVYEEVAHQLEQQLDPRTRHLLVLTGVPLVFPHVPRSAVQQEEPEQNGSKGAQNGRRRAPPLESDLAAKLARSHGVQLLSEAPDCWTNQAERQRLLQQLQEVARAQGVRVTFLSGGTDCSADARIYTPSLARNPQRDPAFMRQVVVGGMANRPASRQLVRALQKGTLDPVTDRRVELHPKFRTKVQGAQGGKLLAQRCWLGMTCEFKGEDNGSNDHEHKEPILLVTLRMESSSERDPGVSYLNLRVPPLSKSAASSRGRSGLFQCFSPSTTQD